MPVAKYVCENCGFYSNNRSSASQHRKKYGHEVKLLERHGVKPPPSQSENETGSGAEVFEKVMSMDVKKIIAPEAALKDVRLEDGDYRRGFIDGMSLLLMAIRYNQVLMATQSEILRGQLEVLTQARGSLAETAHTTAKVVAGEIEARMMEQIGDLRVDIAGIKAREEERKPSEPEEWLRKKQVSVMDMMWNMMEGQMKKMMGASQTGTPQGWTEREE